MLLAFLATNWRLGMVWNVHIWIEPTSKEQHHYSPTSKLQTNTQIWTQIHVSSHTNNNGLCLLVHYNVVDGSVLEWERTTNIDYEPIQIVSLIVKSLYKTWTCCWKYWIETKHMIHSLNLVTLFNDICSIKLLEYLATNWRVLGMVWNAHICIEPSSKKWYHYCSPTQTLQINKDC